MSALGRKRTYNLMKTTKAILILLGVVATTSFSYFIYRDYVDDTERTRIAIAIVGISPLKISIENYWSQKGVFPSDASILGVNPVFATNFKHSWLEGPGPEREAYSISVLDGSISLLFDADQGDVSGKNLVFVPTVVNGRFTWNCNSNVNPKYLPKICQDKVQN